MAKEKVIIKHPAGMIETNAIMIVSGVNGMLEASGSLMRIKIEYPDLKLEDFQTILDEDSPSSL